MIEKPSKGIIENTADIFIVLGILGLAIVLPAAAIAEITDANLEGFIGFIAIFSIVGGIVGYVIGYIIYVIHYLIYCLYLIFYNYFNENITPSPPPPQPSPPPEPPKQPRSGTAIGNIIGKNCPYCQFPFKQGASVVFCPSCEVPHHQECWGENGGCTTYGCSSSPRK